MVDVLKDTQTDARPRPEDTTGRDGGARPPKPKPKPQPSTSTMLDTRSREALASSPAPPLADTRVARDGEQRRAAPPGDTVQVERLGKFLLLRELGRGAMGVVYLAFDEELERRVALKLLHYDSAGNGSSGRHQLLREAQALARLMHPNVVAVHEAGVWNGRVFVVMEYVEGEDLKGWLTSQARPWREVLKVLTQAGAGLLAAHEAGLVHRDFKPSNVLVGKDGRTRVADFGLVTLRHQAEHTPLRSSGSLLTETIAGAGSLVGTPAYMAPEQIRREGTTFASDQFAFNVSLISKSA